ncbi:HTH-type transcriptional repressor purR (purine nucleotide synthesis repressor) [Planococcus donghaensis MPA1U2]|uniref:HTH-type transcriptional repressor purR (Purine nucleotide synthesis repressor) n=1 Tax=Planococcus donghaensis MPA1U2 TaxID=933115 RepID=E7RF23_9BACL|nr:LacI family DNA-binding transcriptional regulator [Planococcus donghaensis]EGA90422.1 HTH-type transcriptional repressor purR (purine nucleotide synthesis repressor) [Planococcus donghaensis MPA1U2]
MDMVSTTDVAKYAGVSQTTVSRVLNKPDQVKKETYDKVMNAVNELNYSSAESEKPISPIVKIKTISLIVGAVDDPIYMNAVPAIISTAQEQGYQVNIHFIAESCELETYETVLSSNPNGIIIIPSLLDKVVYEKLIDSTIPFVALNSSGVASQHSIGLNDIEAGYLATKHLIDVSHLEIAWVGGTLSSPSTKDRLLGFVQALQEANFKIRKKRLVVTDVDKFSLFEAFENLQALKKKPTAIVAATDEIAIQFMDFYKKAGYHIPEDISIVGIGNTEMAQHSALALTSVGTSDSLENLGQEAVKRLFDLVIYNQEEAFHVTRDVELYERATTASLQG